MRCPPREPGSAVDTPPVGGPPGLGRPVMRGRVAVDCRRKDGRAVRVGPTPRSSTAGFGGTRAVGWGRTRAHHTRRVTCSSPRDSSCRANSPVTPVDVRQGAGSANLESDGGPADPGRSARVPGTPAAVTAISNASSALPRWPRSSSHTVLRSLSEGFIATALVMVERAERSVPALVGAPTLDPRDVSVEAAGISPLGDAERLQALAEEHALAMPV